MFEVSCCAAAHRSVRWTVLQQRMHAFTCAPTPIKSSWSVIKLNRCVSLLLHFDEQRGYVGPMSCSRHRAHLHRVRLHQQLPQQVLPCHYDPAWLASGEAGRLAAMRNTAQSASQTGRSAKNPGSKTAYGRLCLLLVRVQATACGSLPLSTAVTS